MLLLCTLALSAPPAVTPSEAELPRLQQGEVVVRASVSEEGSSATGLAVLHATLPNIWKAILDFSARVADSEDLKAAVEYERQSRWDVGIRYTVSILAWGGDFHIRYHWNEAENWCSFALDPNQENILLASEGYYRTDSFADGYLLTYHTRTRTKIYTPDWVQRRVATSSMQDLLEKLKIRAEKVQ